MTRNVGRKRTTGAGAGARAGALVTPRGLARAVLVLALPALFGCPGRAPSADPPGAWTQVPVSVQARLAEDAPREGLTEARIAGEDEVVFLHPDVEVWNDHIRRADAVDQDGEIVLRLWFTPDGAERVAAVTEAHLGRRFALTVNGNVVSAPPIARPVAVDPEIPVAVGVRLPPPEAAQLTDAVARTWPRDVAP